MRKTFITIGAFDGVHLGHKHLILALKDLASHNDMEPLVLYFPYPPKVIISGALKMSVITLPEEKAALLRDLGVRAEALDFDAVRQKSPAAFFDTLSKKYNMGGILAGPDFAFGKDRQGHLDFLSKACRAAGVNYVKADFVNNDEGHKVSSSLIRKALCEGDISKVNAMLGRPYQIGGKIIKGRQIGRTIGFPTANLDISSTKLLPCGIFAATAALGKETFLSVVNIGYRPTVTDTDIPLTEVHILDFNRDIYGKELIVNFNGKIRGEVKFNGLEELKAQIAKDEQTARIMLSIF